MIKKDNQLLGTLLDNCTNVKKRFLITILFFSIFMLFGCSTTQRQVSIKKTKPSTNLTMLTKIESHYKKWQNTPYRYGGTTLAGSDCSGFVMNFFKNKLSKNLPRSAAEQARLGVKVNTPKAGDLVFFKTGRSRSGLHVCIYYADGKFLHASTSKGVVYSNLNDSYWKKHYWMTRRIMGS